MNPLRSRIRSAVRAQTAARRGETVRGAGLGAGSFGTALTI